MPWPKECAGNLLQQKGRRQHALHVLIDVCDLIVVCVVIMQLVTGHYAGLSDATILFGNANQGYENGFQQVHQPSLTLMKICLQQAWMCRYHGKLMEIDWA